MPARDRSILRTPVRRLAAAAAGLLVVTLVAAGLTGGPAAAAAAEAPVAVGGVAAGYAEPVFATDPSNPSLLVGAAIAWQPAGSADAPVIAALRSTDGGATWTQQLLPTPGFAVGFDPSVAFLGPSRVVLGMLAGTRPGCATGGSPVVRLSTDGGATWGAPTVVQDNLAGPAFADKPMVAADPARHRVYVAWSRAVPSATTDSCEAIPSANQLLVAASADAGRTFAPPVAIGAPGYATAFAAAMAVAGDGTLYVAFEASDRGVTPVRAAIYVVRSTDGGASFSPPVRVGAAVEPEEPDGANVFPTSWPAIAIDPTTGRVWVAWTTAWSGMPRVVTASADPGLRGFTHPHGLPGGTGQGAELLASLGQGPAPVLGFLGFADRRLTPYVSVLGPRGFGAPVAASPPVAAGSPFQLGEYLGAGGAGGEAQILWPSAAGGAQRLWFARTGVAVRALPSPTPPPTPSVPASASGGSGAPRTAPAGDAGGRASSGLPGGLRRLLVAAATLLVLILAAGAALRRRAVRRRAARRRGRHRAGSDRW